MYGFSFVFQMSDENIQTCNHCWSYFVQISPGNGNISFVIKQSNGWWTYLSQLKTFEPTFSSLSALKLVKYLLQTTNLEIPWFLATSVFFLIFRKIIIFIPLIYYVIKHTTIFLGYISRPSLVDKMYLSFIKSLVFV